MTSAYSCDAEFSGDKEQGCHGYCCALLVFVCFVIVAVAGDIIAVVCRI